jgi:hypothetical protein
VRVRLRWNEGQPDADLLFRGIPEKGLWAPFSVSVCMQTAVVGLAVSYLHFLAMLPPDPTLEIRRDRVLELSTDPLEDRAITAPSPAAAANTDTGSERHLQRSRRAQATAEPKTLADPALTAPAPPAREFRMPAARAARAVPQTLVQMDLPPTVETHQQLLVPSIVMLASTPHRLAPKPFVAPPQPKNTMPVPSHVALEMRPPILDVRAGYAKTPDVLKDVTPRLAAPVGAVAPVAGNREPMEAKPAAATVTGNTAAEPSNIISLPDRPIPAASSIVLPPLNQVSGRDVASGAESAVNAAGESAGGSGPTPPHSGPGANAASNDSPGSNHPGSNNSGASSGARTPAGAASGANHAGNSASIAPGTGTKAGAGTPAANGAVNGAANGLVIHGGNVPASKTAAGPTRLIRPLNGTYEVAIVQSSGVVPGSNGMLKGKPVYSVYIPVGTGKEWILQYCLPEEDAHPAARSQVVQLGNITPITAPYAYSIIGPAIQFRAGARYAFIHGFVNASGRFVHLVEASDQEIENIAAVLESLGQWEFRPATKDGVPAMVEILLCIPNAA